MGAVLTGGVTVLGGACVTGFDVGAAAGAGTAVDRGGVAATGAGTGVVRGGVAATGAEVVVVVATGADTALAGADTGGMLVVTAGEAVAAGVGGGVFVVVAAGAGSFTGPILAT